MKPVELVLIMRDKTRQGIEAAAGNVEGLSVDYEELIRQIRSADSTMERSGNTARRMASDYGNLQSVLAKIGGTAALIGFGKEIIKVRSEFQNMEASFKVFLGDAEKANAFMKELQSYAFNNVFEFKDLAQQASQLLAYGHNAKEVTSILDKLSNVAAGVNQPLDRFVELYNKAKSRGKLDLIDVQQWSVMGDVIGYLSDMLGKSKEEIRDMVSAGKIGFNEIDALLNKLTGSGGQFAGMMEEKMKTLGDSVGLLQDSLTAMFNELGEKSEDFLRGGILLTNKIVENYEKIGKVLISLIATYGAYKAAVITVTAIEHSAALKRIYLHKITLMLEAAQKMLNATMLKNPYVLIATAAIGLATAMWALRDNTSAAEKAQEKYNNTIKDANDKFNELMSIVRDETKAITDRQDALEKLRVMYPSLFGNMNMEAVRLANLAKLTKEATKAELERASVFAKTRMLEIDSEIQNNTGWTSGGLARLQRKNNVKRLEEEKKVQENIIQEYQNFLDEEERLRKKAEEESANAIKNKSYWENIKKEAEDARNALDVSKKNSEDWIKYTKQIEEAQKQIDNYSDKKTGGSDDIQKRLDAGKRLAEIEQQQALELARFRLDMRQRDIDLMDDNFIKKLRQLQLNQDKEMQTVREFEQNKLKEQQKIEEEQWKAKGSVGVFKPTTVSVEQLPEGIKEQVAQMEKAISAAFKSGVDDWNKQIWDSLQEQEVAFKSTLEKELYDIDAHYEDLITKSEWNERLINQLKENHAIARKKAEIKNRLSEIDFNEALTVEKAKGLESISMTELSEEKKLEVQRKYIKLRIEALNQLADAGDEDARRQAKVLEETLKNLDFKKPALSLKALGDKAIFDAIKKNFEKMGDSAEAAEEKTVKLLSSIHGAAGTIANIAGELKSAFAGLDKDLDEALDAVSNIANGFEKGGIVGGIFAIVGEGVKLLNKASETEKQHQEALMGITSEKLAMQHAYNLALLEQNLLLKEATSIFGEKEITKSANAINVYIDAIDKFNKALKGSMPDKGAKSADEFVEKYMKGNYQKQIEAYEKGIGALYQITTKTGHEKTGLFGLGKGKDVYAPIIEQYEDLLTAEGKLNIERAKSILNAATMSDENRALLQSLIDLQEAAESAQEALRDYLKNTFGTLGSDLMDSIAASIQDKGVNAWESFGDAGSKVIENLGKQLAYELFFADKFKKLQESLESVYGETTDPEEIARKQLELVSQFYNQIGNDMDAAQAFMENWQKEAEKSGFNLWKSADESAASQKGKPGTFTSMTQEQAGKLEGLFTSLQNHAASIDNVVTGIGDTMYEALDFLIRIAENTEYCKFLKDIYDNTERMIRDGMKVK